MDDVTLDLAGSPVFVRRAPGPAGGSGPGSDPIVFLHTAPTSSDDWLGLLERTGGYAPDLPGFGRSGKGGHLALTLDAQAGFVTRLLDALELPRVALVGHGWGATAGLVAAARAPQRVSCMVLLDAALPPAGAALPALVARLRRPALGELLMGSVNRRVLARILRGASGDGMAAWPDAAVAAIWEQFDQGTQRATLRLLRSADPAALAAAAAAAERVGVPALVLWGVEDPWCAATWGRELARRLPDATLELIGGAGHWPWREQPKVADRIVRWLADAPRP